jgi:DNA-binding CsgD family transcriptional regulator/Tfp pilus assembly protein PilF
MPVRSSHLVGRDDLLDDILALLEVPGAVVTLVGEPGIGKTSVLVEALGRARVKWRWAWQCLEAEAELGLAVLADLFASAPLSILEALPDPQRRAVDVVLYRAPVDREQPVDERLLGATTLSLLRARAAVGPILIGLDDLQWCDPTSLAALSYALPRLGDTPVAMLAACRPGTDRVLARSTRVEVARLSSASVGVLVAEVLGADAGGPTVAQIADISGGNPFFARELARHRAASPADARLPASIRELLNHRLTALSAAGRAPLLDVAVRGAMPADEPGFGDFREALDAEVVTIGDGRVTFSHPLLATTVAQGATREQLRQAHHRAAEAATDPVTAALHRARCSAPGNEIAAELDDATEIALQRGDLAGARVLARLAVELSRGTEQPASRWLRLARLESAFDDAPAAAELSRRVLRSNPSPKERVRATLLLAEEVSYRDSGDAALRMLQEVSATTGVPLEERQELAAEMAAYLFLAGRTAEAISTLEQMITLVPHVTSRLSSLVGQLAWLKRCAGVPDDGELLRQVIDSGRSVDSDGVLYTTATYAASIAAVLAVLDDRHADAARLLQQAEISAARRGERNSAALFTGVLSCRMGRLRQAELELRRAGETDSRNPQACARLAVVHGWLGDSQQGAEDVHRAEEILPDAGWYRFRTEVRFASAFLNVLAGRYDAAWPMLRDTAAEMDAVGYREPSQPPVLPLAVEVAAALGLLEEAETLCARLERDSAGLASRFGVAAARRGRGFIALTRGQHEAAERFFAEAAALFHAAELPLEAARSQLALGGLLRRIGQRRRAREALDTARSIFTDCGALGLLREAEAELAQISGRVAGAPTELTESERRVADLIGRGMRNADVARTLHLSVKTVETHLGHVYRKLGVTNRAELIATFHRPMDG